MDAEERLAGVQGGVDERVDFVDAGICHGVAADRHAFAVHHDRTAGAPVRAVVGVRVAESLISGYPEILG